MAFLKIHPNFDHINIEKLSIRPGQPYSGKPLPYPYGPPVITPIMPGPHLRDKTLNDLKKM